MPGWQPCVLAPSNAEHIAGLRARALLCAADKYEVQSARIAGDSRIVASGKQLSSGCAVVLKFFVDEDDFLHLKRFHHQARDVQYIPGEQPSFGDPHSAGMVPSRWKKPEATLMVGVLFQCPKGNVGITS